jgi:hypothetical protein
MRINSKGLCSAFLFASISLSNFAIANDLTPLSDVELAAETGQALFNLSYLAPSQTGNSNAGMGFYKLGLEAELQINANIKKLQLGCGGVNGAGNCDIDIDNLSLSGVSETSDGRASSSAVLTNPFIQLAIKNPNTASTRELAGVRLSAEKIIGMLTFGTENSAQLNGIKSLSGYLEVAATTGTALVNGYGTSNVSGEASKGQLIQSDGYNAINGKACCLFFGGNLNFNTTSYELNLRDKATGSNILKGDLTLPQQAITGKRINTAILNATAKVRDIDLTGHLVAKAAGIINLDKQATGLIQNLIVDATINENLGLFHKIDLNGTPASLSLQSQNLTWPGAKSVAQRGWWLEFSNPVDIGKIDPVEKVDIPKATLNAALDQVSNYLNDNPDDCGAIFAINCLAGSTIPVGTVNLINAPHASLILNNLQLVKQDFAPNCYGGLTFC